MLSKFIVIFACVALANCTDISECEEGTIPGYVVINDCRSEPCDFHEGSNLTAIITFEVPTLVYKMQTSVKASFGDVSYTYPVDSDACSGMIDPQCPLEVGATAHYNFKLTLPSDLSAVKVQLEVKIESITDEEKETLVCFRVSGNVIPQELAEE